MAEIKYLPEMVVKRIVIAEPDRHKSAGPEIDHFYVQTITFHLADGRKKIFQHTFLDDQSAGRSMLYPGEVLTDTFEPCYGLTQLALQQLEDRKHATAN